MRIGCLVALATMAAAHTLIFPPRATADSLTDGKRAYQARQYSRALSVLQSLGEAKDAQAQFLIGEMYRQGQGVAADPQTAEEWYRQSAQQGYAAAQVRMGIIEYKRLQTKVALDWFRKAADQNDADGQFYVGVTLAHGRGGPPDPSKSLYWLEKAAAQGHVQSQVSAGQLYLEAPEGIARNERRAARWFRQAAERGNAEGQFRLAMAYTTGSGVA
jgi:TPR repeat protein